MVSASPEAVQAGQSHDRRRTERRPPPVTPGKAGTWVFLATEVMFFTGLIGSYIVLRSGSPMGSYSNLYPPGTALTRLADTHGVVLLEAGRDPPPAPP